MKTELQKLVTLSRDTIDLNLGHAEIRTIFRDTGSATPPRQTADNKEANPTSGSPLGGGDSSVGGLMYDPEEADVGLTYEQMHATIESVLQESGYYKLDSNHRHENGRGKRLVADPLYRTKYTQNAV